MGGGLRWRSWLKRYATSRKVAGSIPIGISLEFFIDIILPTAIWPLSSTKPLTEMSTSNISWG